MKLPKQAQSVMHDASVAKREIMLKLNRCELDGIYPASLSGCWGHPTTVGVVGCALEAAWDWLME